MKKEQERIFALALLSKLNVSHLDLKEFEEPDFLFNLNEIKHGLEVTRIFQSYKKGTIPPRAQESEKKLIVNDAWNKFISEGGSKNMDVSVHFGKYPEIKKSERSLFVGKLLQIIRDNIPITDNTIWLHNDFEDLDYFPEQFSHIRISNFSFLKNGLWRVPQGGFVQKNFSQELQNILDNKNKKIKAYLNNCEKCWLLIVADSNFSSAFFNPDIETINQNYTSQFDKSFCMWEWYGDFFELKP
jgi:hypothetical protein